MTCARWNCAQSSPPRRSRCPPSGPCPQSCSSLVVLYRVGALRERRQPVSCSRSHGAAGPLDETPTTPAASACGFCETPTTPACPKRKKSGRCGGTGVVAVSPGVGALPAGVVAVSPGAGERRTDSPQRRWSHALGGRAWTPAGGRKPVAGTVRVAGELGRDIPYPAASPGAPRHRRPDTTKHAEPNAPVGAKAARSGRVWSPGHTGPACPTTVRPVNACAHPVAACINPHGACATGRPSSPRPWQREAGLIPGPVPGRADPRGRPLPRQTRTCGTMEA